MLLAAVTWHIREKTKYQAFITNATCFRNCQSLAFQTSHFVTKGTLKRRQGSWGRTERFKGKTSPNKLRFQSNSGTKAETSMPETEWREEGWDWIVCFKDYLPQFHMSVYYRLGLKHSSFCISTDEATLFQHLLHKIVLQFHRHTLPWSVWSVRLTIIMKEPTFQSKPLWQGFW